MVLGSFGVGAHACGTSKHRSNDPAFISFVILPDLTDQDLEKIGVASLNHRRLLLRAIANCAIRSLGL